MNKKGAWNGMIGIVLVVFAFIIVFGFFTYTTGTLQENQETSSQFQNSTTTALESLPIMNAMIYVLLIVVFFVAIYALISVLTKLSTGARL